ncbi:MAG: carotenoid oxygenase family protein [Bacteriovoracaceae bacterium]|nr:carotenoid oxygenase family protein [Bacteriovoracaceae bacterium]
MNRRKFCQFILVSAAFTKAPLIKGESSSSTFIDIDWSTARLSLRAYRSVSDSGLWSLEDIEGEIPRDLEGKLLRVGPGLKENHKTQLKHFFDGDAYLQCLSFSNGSVTLQAEFINTPERAEELKKGEMIYNEFGTMAPKKTRKLKNQPNISIVPWRENYLALSEGGHPVLLKEKDLSYKEQHDFKGTLPKNVSFTAHPKFERDTGVGYGFGIKQGMSKSLMVYRMNPTSGELEELYNLPQPKVFMIHDFLVSENYIVFLIPPAFFKLTDIIFNRGSMGDSMQYDENLGTRLIVLEKKKKGKRREYRLPSSLSFHHGNLYEDGEDLCFTSFQARDASLLSHISNWHESPRRNLERPNAFQWRFNLSSGSVIEKRLLAKAHDFPFFNPRFLGKRNQYLYSTEMGEGDDPMRFKGISKIDTDLGIVAQYKAQVTETFGEPVYYESKSLEEDGGYLFVPGYSKERDQSFVDLLEAKEMKRMARIWLGGFFPVGFHGHFISA